VKNKGLCFTSSVVKFKSFATFSGATSAALYCLLTEIVCQLSVENAIAKSAAAAKENIEAKHKVTALQNAILKTIDFQMFQYTKTPYFSEGHQFCIEFPLNTRITIGTPIQSISLIFGFR
jgi:hypothetical protein